MQKDSGFQMTADQNQDDVEKYKDEIWKRVPEEYLDYEVSTHGRIRRNGKFLKLCNSSQGYLLAHVIRKDRKPKSILMHRLICLAFGIIEAKDHVNHKDGNKKNNHISNLEKSNPSHNGKHAYSNGLIKPTRGQRNGMSKLTERQAKAIITHYSRGVSIKRIASLFKVSKTAAHNIAIGHSWKNLNDFRKLLKIKPRSKKNRILNAAYEESLK